MSIKPSASITPGATYAASYSFENNRVPSAVACITVTLNSNPEDDLLRMTFGVLPRAGEQRDPQIINVHTLLDGCELLTPYNGFFVEPGRTTLQIFYDFSSKGPLISEDDHREVLALAMLRIRGRLDLLINERNTKYRRDPQTNRLHERGVVQEPDDSRV